MKPFLSETIARWEDRKAEGKTHKEQMMRLKTSLAKEREERQVDMARLEGKLERQGHKIGLGPADLLFELEQFEAKLVKAKAQQQADMRSISEVHTIIMLISVERVW
jgi:hypothetical protein